MNFLTNILENSNLPILSAFVLGLMTAISPCPLTTNITAIGYISKDIGSRRKVFYNGVLYTLGRSVSYVGLALIIYLGADQFKFSGFFQKNGEKFIGPLLVIIGLFMLDLIRINFPGVSSITSVLEKKMKGGYLFPFLLGIVFALAFCPYSGVLYFGMLIPMTVTSTPGLFLPLVFAAATGIPVIFFAYILAFSINSTGILFNKLKSFEAGFRKIIAILFISAGAYYIIKIIQG
jgi:cytochrome c biogenesis protein CcdA